MVSAGRSGGFKGFGHRDAWSVGIGPRVKIARFNTTVLQVDSFGGKDGSVLRGLLVHRPLRGIITYVLRSRI